MSVAMAASESEASNAVTSAASDAADDDPETAVMEGAEAAEEGRSSSGEEPTAKLQARVAALERSHAELTAANRELSKLKVRKRAVRIAALEAANKELEAANMAHRDNETSRNSKLKKFYERRCVALHEDQEKQLSRHREIASALENENARLLTALREARRGNHTKFGYDEEMAVEKAFAPRRNKRMRLADHVEVNSLSDVNGRLVKMKFDVPEMDLGCRRCRRNAREILFLPCAHLVLCAECANMAETCAICHAFVVSKHFASIVD